MRAVAILVFLGMAGGLERMSAASLGSTCLMAMSEQPLLACLGAARGGEEMRRLGRGRMLMGGGGATRLRGGTDSVGSDEEEKMGARGWNDPSEELSSATESSDSTLGLPRPTKIIDSESEQERLIRCGKLPPPPPRPPQRTD